MSIHGDRFVETSRECCPSCGRPNTKESHGVKLEGDIVSHNGQSARLTRKEREIFGLLLKQFGNTVHRDRLWSLVWNNEEVDPKIIDVYFSRLRRKIAPLGLTFRSAWGIGHALVFIAAAPVANVA